jgi:hypothetical protein
MTFIVYVTPDCVLMDISFLIHTSSIWKHCQPNYQLDASSVLGYSVCMTIWTDPTHPEWFDVSRRTNDFVDHLIDRGDVTVVISPDTRTAEEKKKRHRPPGVFYPTLGRLHLDASQTLPKNLQELSTVNLLSKLSQRRYPAFTGVTVHEAAHAKHTLHRARHDNYFINDWIAVLEEPRCEHKMAVDYPQYIPHLKSASKHIFGKESFAMPNIKANEKMSKRYEAARVAILVLGRAEGGIFTEDEVKNVYSMCRTVFGRNDLNEIIAVIKDSFTIDDNDADSMIKLAIRVQNIVDPEEEAEADDTADQTTPCGSPSPTEDEDDDDEDSEEEDTDDSAESDFDDDSEGEDTDENSGGADSEDKNNDGKDSDDADNKNSEGEDADGEESDSENSEGSDSEGEGSEGEGSEGSEPDSNGEGSEGSEGNGSSESASDDHSEESGESSNTGQESGTSSNGKSTKESSNEKEDNDPSDAGEESSQDSPDGSESNASNGSDSKKDDPKDELKGDQDVNSGPGKKKKGTESDEESSDGEVDSADPADSVDESSADREVNSSPVSDLIKEAINSIGKASTHGTVEAGEQGKPAPIAPKRNVQKENLEHRKEINAAKQTVDNPTVQNIGGWGLDPSVPLIVSQPPSAKDVSRSKVLGQAIGKAQFRAVDKTILNSLTPPGKFNVRQAMNRSAQLTMKQEVTATPWKQTRHREVDNPPITLAVASDVSMSMGAWQREVSSFTWAFSQAVSKLDGKSGAVVWNTDTYSLIKPGRAPKNIPVAKAAGGSSGLPNAMRALDGLMGLSFGEGVRLLTIITDGELPNTGEIQEVITKLHSYGVKILWILTSHRGWKPKHASIAVLNTPEEFGKIVSQQMVEALSRS